MAKSEKIRFMLHGERKSVFPGSMQPREFQRLDDKIKELAKAVNMGGGLSEDWKIWIANLGNGKLARKLAKVGLIELVDVETGLDAFCTSYIAIKRDIGQSTIANLNVAKNRLIAFWGANKDIRKITKANVTELKSSLLKKYADATVGRTLGRGKEFFAYGVDSKIIAENPFDKVKVPSQVNKQRMRFVNREVAQKVLDACPSAEWRLIFALARFGGLRVPSELVGLKWSDVLWEQGKVRIESPKTARIGKPERYTPMFPELVEPLRECFEGAKDGSVYVFEKKITDKTNLRKRLQGIIQKAGVVAWPKLFQNLRASRETELAGLHPIHVVTSWLGNTPEVALRHYLQVTDEDFKKGINSGTWGVVGDANLVMGKSDQKSDQLLSKSDQNDDHRGGSQMFADVQQLLENPEVMKNLAVIAEELKKNQVTSLGLELMPLLAVLLRKLFRSDQKSDQNYSR